MTMNACRKVMMSFIAVGHEWILVVNALDDRMLMLMVNVDSIAVSAFVVILVEFDRI